LGEISCVGLTQGVDKQRRKSYGVNRPEIRTKKMGGGKKGTRVTLSPDVKSQKKKKTKRKDLKIKRKCQKRGEDYQGENWGNEKRNVGARKGECTG